jgi:MoxR-like ATPase
MKPMDIQGAEEKVERLRRCCRELEERMSQSLVGQRDVVRLLLTGLMAGDTCWSLGFPDWRRP